MQTHVHMCTQAQRDRDTEIERQRDHTVKRQNAGGCYVQTWVG